MAETDVLVEEKLYKCPNCRGRLCVIDIIGEAMVYCHHCKSRIRLSIVPAEGYMKPAKLRIALRNDSVEINGVQVIGGPDEKIRQVFGVLCNQFMKDAAKNRRPDEYRGLTGRELANMVDWDEIAVRQAINRLRKRIQDCMKKECGILVSNTDIIENMRKWKGYRINPKTAMITSE